MTRGANAYGANRAAPRTGRGAGGRPGWRIRMSPRDEDRTDELADRKTDQSITTAARALWAARYGERHRQVRIKVFPAGIFGPKKVRIYSRRDHFVLQVWDPGAKATVSDRVDGDLVSAIARAREIEDRLTVFRSAGRARDRRVSHADLVRKFVADLRRRADAGEVAAGTAGRYESALRHFLAFAGQPKVAKAFPTAGTVNRDFRLGLAGFLADRAVTGNGRAGAAARPMRGQGFVVDAVRGLYEWAADPDRGGFLPAGFRNPFVRTGETRAVFRGDPLAPPDITMAMATAFVRACDEFERRLFVPVILFGLRAAEPCFLFREHVSQEWLLVPNIEGLDYQTKGRRDKRFPLVADLAPLWAGLRAQGSRGLLYVRRAVADGNESPPLAGASLDDLVAEYRRRVRTDPTPGRAARLRVRSKVLREAGGLRYDDIQHAFGRVAGRLGWPRTATLKDFRHLFATTLANAALPEGYRKYLMGHAAGRDATVAYTHLSDLRAKFEDVVRAAWGSVTDVVCRRLEAPPGPPGSPLAPGP
ncbi:MAG: hypothetical protein JWO38_4643 [Gemmataceae bacterium]|nr:hypothetical protein [Gemmataceae bacterium]